MTDILLSSFLSLFALFGKEEQVEEARAKAMLVSYMRHHFGIRNIDSYLDLYSDMRLAYEMAEGLNVQEAVTSICSNLRGKIRSSEASLLLLRLMEFSQPGEQAAAGDEASKSTHPIFHAMADTLGVSDEAFNDYQDFVNARETDHVRLHRLEGFDGIIKTLLTPQLGQLIFTYSGPDTVLLNDVPVLSGSYRVWLQSSVLP